MILVKILMVQQSEKHSDSECSDSSVFSSSEDISYKMLLFYYIMQIGCH